MAGGSKIKIKGGIASKGEAVVIDGALLVTDLGPGVGGAVRYSHRFYGENPGNGATSVDLMTSSAGQGLTALGIPMTVAVQTRNVAVRFRRDAGAPPGDWTLRLFRNDVEVATFTVGTT